MPVNELRGSKMAEG